MIIIYNNNILIHILSDRTQLNFTVAIDFTASNGRSLNVLNCICAITFYQRVKCWKKLEDILKICMTELCSWIAAMPKAKSLPVPFSNPVDLSMNLNEYDLNKWQISHAYGICVIIAGMFLILILYIQEIAKMASCLFSQISKLNIVEQNQNQLMLK